MQTTTRPASQKQFDFLKRLVAERQMDAYTEMAVANGREVAMRGEMTSTGASALIDRLLSMPKKEQDETPASRPEPEAGIYLYGGRMYRVYLGQQSGKMLVKQVDAQFSGTACYCSDLQGVNCGVCRGDVERRKVTDVTYTYLGSATGNLPPAARRLSLEEVGSIGIAWNHCVICGRRLDDPESVDRGIGPVCAKKY